MNSSGTLPVSSHQEAENLILTGRICRACDVVWDRRSGPDCWLCSERGEGVRMSDIKTRGMG